jgi:multidrug efflux pump subunit AcrB
MFATATNVVSYGPYLLLTGTTGEFLYSLPIVIAAALIASRIVSMTFIPLLSFYLLKPKDHEASLEDKRKQGFSGFYYKVTEYTIDNRKRVLVFSLAFLVIGASLRALLKHLSSRSTFSTYLTLMSGCLVRPRSLPQTRLLPKLKR